MKTFLGKINKRKRFWRKNENMSGEKNENVSKENIC
jgi:hypothetical protein